MADQVAGQAGVGETFAEYLAKYLIARKGFVLGTVAEAAELQHACDRVLTYADGMTMAIYCLVDRERRPEAAFGMRLTALQAIGEACLVHNGRMNGRRMPVVIWILEIGGGEDWLDRRRALERLKTGHFSKVRVVAGQVDPRDREIWLNQFLLVGRRMLAGLLRQPRLPPGELVAPAQALTRPAVLPILTGLMVAVLAAVFFAEWRFAGNRAGLLFAPDIRTLVVFGGLNRHLVLDDGEWYRLLTSSLLHGDLGHLFLNAVALGFAGFSLERLVGRGWFFIVFFVSGLTGAVASLVLNAPNVVSVGTSGAVSGLFAAMMVLSWRFPVGRDRAALQMTALGVLVPTLLPLAALAKGIPVDVAAHVGGAIGGGVVGWLVRRLWPREIALPLYGTAAGGIATAAGLLYGLSAWPVALELLARSGVTH